MSDAVIETLAALAVIAYAIDKIAHYSTVRMLVTGKPLLERKHKDDEEPHGLKAVR